MQDKFVPVSSYDAFNALLMFVGHMACKIIAVIKRFLGDLHCCKRSKTVQQKPAVKRRG